MVSNLVTVVKGSCKRRVAQFAKTKDELKNGVHRSGQGLNQETNVKRLGDHIMGLFST